VSLAACVVLAGTGIWLSGLVALFLGLGRAASKEPPKIDAEWGKRR
jgi:hypothetical protein